jgi:hypothetical protein
VVEEVLLYDVNKVAEINSLKARAGNELQGFTTGLGFWGSPGWVIGGALALGAVEGMISNATSAAPGSSTTVRTSSRSGLLMARSPSAGLRLPPTYRPANHNRCCQ